MSDQAVALPGVGNARELGGYAAGGKMIKKGVLIRTADLSGAAPEAINKLEKELNIQTVVDFRMSGERKQKPDPQISGSESISLPVLEMEDVPSSDTETLRLYTDPNTDRMRLFEKVYETGMLGPQLYTGFLLRERGKQSFRSFFEALLSLEEGRGFLWHCTDGKDRTGCAAMLLLFALGASKETVMADYLLTNAYNAEKLDPVREKLNAVPMPPEKLDALLFVLGGVSERYMDTAIDTLERTYGSVTAYLEQELGVGEKERMQLRDMLLTDMVVKE